MTVEPTMHMGLCRGHMGVVWCGSGLVVQLVFTHTFTLLFTQLRTEGVKSYGAGTTRWDQAPQVCQRDMPGHHTNHFGPKWQGCSQLLIAKSTGEVDWWDGTRAENITIHVTITGRLPKK